ncbi:MAG: hypothetical protein ACXAEN_27195 [Candidatus Thorarchaeota archaeon]|jgi:hypothetical protein
MSDEIELRDGVCCYFCHHANNSPSFRDAMFCKKHQRDVLKVYFCNRKKE